MRIFHLEAGRSMFGGPYQVAGLLSGLPPEFENHLGCPLGSEIARLDLGTAVTHQLPWASEVDPRTYFALTRKWRALRPDLVHIHSRRGADSWGVVAARALGIPHIITRRVDNPEKPWLARWRYRDCARVIGISDRICEVLKTTGVPASKVSLVRDGVDLECYRPAPRSDRLRSLFALPEDALTVGMIAQFIPRKGHADLVAASREVIVAHPQTRFILFGKGKLRAEIEQQVDALGLRPSFLFPGFRDDLPELLPQLDVVAHPAHAEGLGVALLQASACEVPIVAGRAGGIPEVVRDGETGFLVTPGQPDALAQRLVELLADENLRQRMGAAGRQFVHGHCSMEAMAAGNAAIYREVLPPVRKPSDP